MERTSNRVVEFKALSLEVVITRHTGSTFIAFTDAVHL